MLEGVPDAISASAYGLGSDRVRESLRQLPVNTNAGCGAVGDFTRFEKPALLSGFLGIVPSEYSSDKKRTQGQITKAGPSNARRLLVEAAHNYRHRPAIGENLKARQSGQDPRVVEIAWRCQRRLHGRWLQLAGKRGKPAGTVAVAVARELAAFCWEAATLD